MKDRHTGTTTERGDRLFHVLHSGSVGNVEIYVHTGHINYTSFKLSGCNPTNQKPATVYVTDTPQEVGKIVVKRAKPVSEL